MCTRHGRNNYYNRRILDIIISIYVGAVAVQSTETTDGTGQIWLDSVACAAGSTSLTDCSISTFGGHNCNHGQDVGVICQG